MTNADTSADDNSLDAEIDAFKKDVDRTLLRENLKLTVTQRFQKHRQVARFAEKLRNAAQITRGAE
jgi:hypothetical protein